MVSRSCTTRQRQLCKTNPCRNIGGFFVKRAPQRIQRLQPTKQRSIGHRRKRPREVLKHVVMRIDETRCNETISCINDASCLGLSASTSNTRNQTVGDCDPTAKYFSSSVVYGCNECCVANNEIGCCVQLFNSTSSLPALRMSPSRCRK